MKGSIYPCLWFDGKARQAAEFYCKIFKESKILSENPMVVIFELSGKKFMGLNGGPRFTFNESVSFVIDCETQDEIDYYWSNLIADGGEESMCGWLKDKYGVSWQVVPSMLGQWMSEPGKGKRVIEAFLKMKKFDIEPLKNA